MTRSLDQIVHRSGDRSPFPSSNSVNVTRSRNTQAGRPFGPILTGAGPAPCAELARPTTEHETLHGTGVTFHGAGSRGV